MFAVVQMGDDAATRDEQPVADTSGRTDEGT